MFKTIVKASQNFCIHQIRLPYTTKEEVLEEKMFITYIDIESMDKKTFRVYVATQQNFTQRVSKIFLEEDESDEETLIDMALETANLIVGSAKVIAQEEGKNPYNIATPHFQGISSFDVTYDEIIVFEIENDHMIIAIKELSSE
ncbi:MAG: chemotaxis protein CheX [Epsilonproteobacteria bacterium]|nr:chemotaxis protein CheX [Campylobacterota bacterium]